MAVNETIVVNNPLDLTQARDEAEKPKPSDDIISWVMSNVDEWRQIRDSAHKARWDEYHDLWRGIAHANQKSKKSERSRLVSSGSMMAVDLTAAELIDGLFGRRNFFGLSDDATPEERTAAETARQNLTTDLYKAGIRDVMAEAALNGTLYGTGIVKLAIDVETIASPELVPEFDDEGNQIGETLAKVNKEVVHISPVAIEPGQFVPDPSATNIDDMLGCAHEFRLPLHKISARQKSGAYYKVPVTAGTYDESESSTQQRRVEEDNNNEQWANVTEWHGLVPQSMLLGLASEKNDDPIAGMLVSGVEDDMVEAIVTIANGGVLLRAIANPCVMEDRAIVSWQHDTVPNSFWGRGVMEKAYNAQKATDAEMRARIDNLALVSNPMLAVDTTMLPPGSNLNVWPGKVWGTRGDPRAAIQELRFGDINGSSFQQTGELQQMLQQATGTVDATTARSGIRDEATGAAAIQQSGFIKRAKRTMFNVEGAMTKLIRRSLWRKMQFEPERYPADYDFVVEGAVGLMAREMEQQQLVQMLQFTEQGSPEQMAILKQLFQHQSGDAKNDIIDIIDKKIQGPSEEEQQAIQQKQQQAEQLQLENATLQNEKLKAEIAKLGADAGVAESKAELAAIQARVAGTKVQLDVARLDMDQQEVDNQKAQLSLSAEKNQLERAKFIAENR